MRPTGKTLFYCPLCKNPLKQSGHTFTCPTCQSQYSQKRGIPQLLPPEDDGPQNHFTFAGKDIPQVAKKTPTPFYLFAEKIIEENFRQLKTSFSQNGKVPLKIYYSAKTNYEPAVLKTLKNLGSGLEVAWGAELCLAQKLRFEKEKICFDGPVKTNEDLKEAIKLGIKINADSFVEAEKISQIASSLKRTALIGFRINPGLESILSSPIRAYFTKFGIPIDQVLDIYLKANQLPNLKIVNISSHLGSQVISPKPYLSLIQTLANLAKQLEENGIVIKEINIGGGLPSPTLKLGLAKKLLKLATLDFGLKIPSLAEFGWKIAEKYLKETNELKSRPVLALEPGRSLVSNAGVLVTRVVVVKDNHWLFLDGSKYAVPESLFFSRGEIIVANKYNQPAKNHYHVAGSSLNTGDIFALRVQLPPVEPGDIVAILDAGAYSISRAIQFTVLNPPIYYLRKNGKMEKIRRQGTYADTLSPCIFS